MKKMRLITLSMCVVVCLALLSSCGTVSTNGRPLGAIADDVYGTVFGRVSTNSSSDRSTVSAKNPDNPSCIEAKSNIRNNAGPSQNDTHQYVDLGLPSGTLWATCNIGAKSPEEYGDYFAWGETKGYNSGKTDFYRTYKWINGGSITKYNNDSDHGIVDNKEELDLKDDVAYVNWGSAWRMPSDEQFDELIDESYTTTEWTTQKGVNGLKVTSKKNGKSIFLPAAGFREYILLSAAGSHGGYWSRTLYSFPYYAGYLRFDSNDIYTGYGDRDFGRSVRPVRLS